MRHLRNVLTLLILPICCLLALSCTDGVENGDSSSSVESMESHLEKAIDSGSDGVIKYMDLKSKSSAWQEEKSALAFLYSRSVLSGEAELLPLVQAQNPEIRAFAAETLGLVGGDKNLNLLLTLIKDNNEKVRFAAAEALAMLSTDKSERALLDKTDVEKTLKNPALLHGLSLSRERTVTVSLARFLIDNWNKYYMDDLFLKSVSIIRYLYRTDIVNRVGYDQELIDKALTISIPKIRLISLLARENTVNVLIEIHQRNHAAGKKKRTRAALQGLAINNDQRSLAYLFAQHRNSTIDSSTTKKTIQSSFKTHSYLSLHGTDEQKLESLKVLSLFLRTNMRDKVKKLCVEVKDRNSRNINVRNSAANCIKAYEQNRNNTIITF